MLFDQQSLTHLYLGAIITAVCGLLALIIRAYLKYRLVKISIRKSKPKERAEILRATAEVLREQRGRRGSGQAT